MPTYFDKDRKTYYVKFRYKNYAGQTKQKTKRGFKRKKDANEYELHFKSMLNGKLDFPFSMLRERYFEHQKTVVRDVTYTTVSYYFGRYISPFWDNIIVSDITTKTVMDWYDTFLAKHKLADTTLRSITSMLSAIFNFAHKYYGMASNPVRDVGTLGSYRRKKDYPIWTAEQLEKFCASLYSEKVWLWIVYKLLFYTGMRPCEALALSADDIDLEARTIHVSKSFHYRPQNKGGCYCTPPKNAFSDRIIDIPKSLIEPLRIHIDNMKRVECADRVFPTFAHQLNFWIKRNAPKAGVPVIRLYDERHSHASMLINGGQDINLISDRLGHSSPQTTLKVYSHMYKHKKAGLVSFLDEAEEKAEKTSKNNEG